MNGRSTNFVLLNDSHFKCIETIVILGKSDDLKHLDALPSKLSATNIQVKMICTDIDLFDINTVTTSESTLLINPYDSTMAIERTHMREILKNLKQLKADKKSREINFLPINTHAGHEFKLTIVCKNEINKLSVINFDTIIPERSLKISQKNARDAVITLTKSALSKATEKFNAPFLPENNFTANTSLFFQSSGNSKDNQVKRINPKLWYG